MAEGEQWTVHGGWWDTAVKISRGYPRLYVMDGRRWMEELRRMVDGNWW